MFGLDRARVRDAPVHSGDWLLKNAHCQSARSVNFGGGNRCDGKGRRMAYVRLDDNVMAHPKVIGLSDRAFRLWVWSLTYAQQHLTDGFIPGAAVKAQRGAASARDLVAVALWHDSDGGFMLHDWLAHNDSKAVTVARREQGAKRLQSWRQKRGGNEDVTALHAHDRNAVVTSTLTSPHLTSPQVVPGGTTAAGPGRHAPMALGLRRLRVFRWMLDDFIAALGPHAATFDLHAWLADVDARPEVLPRDVFPWLRAELLTEAARRGLPVASEPSAESKSEAKRKAVLRELGVTA